MRPTACAWITAAAAIALTACEPREGVSVEIDDPTLTRVATRPSETVVLASVPDSAEAFAHRCKQHATTPAGAAAMYVTALLMLPENADLAGDCAAIACDDAYVGRDGQPTGTLKFLLGQHRSRPDVARSYVQGTSPADGYALPNAPYTVLVYLPDDYRPARPPTPVKVFGDCRGADTSRPVTVTRGTDGLWRVHEASSLAVGVRRK